MLPRKVVLFSSLLLLVLVFSSAYAQDKHPVDEDEDDSPANRGLLAESVSRRPRRSTTTHSTTAGHSGATHTTTNRPRTTRAPRSTQTTTNYYPHKPYDPKEDKRPKDYGKYNNDRYGGRHRNNKYDDDDDDDYKVIGEDGIHPGEYGQDMGDFGPIYGDKDSMSASLNVWIRAADDWERNDRPRYRNKYRGKKYNKNKNYKDKNYKDNDYKDKDYKDKDYKEKDTKNKDYEDKDYKEKDKKDKNYKDKNYKDDDSKGDYDYKKDDRKKHQYSRIEFPVRQYKDINKFPRRNFPPLISIFPWLPIFYDKLTYQTFIFSPTGGIYILPPLINFYGQRFAVAQLIKWGYASLVSSGAPPPPNVNVAPLVQPAPVPAPAPAPAPGNPPAEPRPVYDTKKNQFYGGVKTDFPDFKPRYSQKGEEGDRGYGYNREVNRNSYGTDSNYGGTGRQEVYPQGGPRTGGGYN